MDPIRHSFPLRMLILLAALHAFPAPAAGADAVRLSIGDAARIAIERNLGLKSASFDPAIAETGIRKARAIYDPALAARVDHNGSNLQAAPGSTLVDRSRFFDFDASISQLLSTGATTSVSFTNQLSRNSIGLSSSRSARPELSLSFSQPLLKGIGREVTERGITTAEDAMDTSLAEWSRQALETAAAARARYLDLVKARENLSTLGASLELARQVHAENEGRVKAGVLASYQLQDSLLGVLQRRADLLVAERAARDAADRLLAALNLPAGTVLSDAGTPPPESAEYREDDAMRTAMELRPEIAGARIAVRNAELNERVTRNLSLPSLALEGSAGVVGLGRDYGEGFEDMSGGDYTAWSVGLSFSVPLGNRSARADHAAARLRASQARVQLASAEEAAGTEVRTALRAVESRREEIAVTEQGVRVAETQVELYRKRQQLGLATTKELLDVETGLTRAKVGYSAARADYHSALTDLWRATGELLDRTGLRKGNP